MERAAGNDGERATVYLEASFVRLACRPRSNAEVRDFLRRCIPSGISGVRARGHPRGAEPASGGLLARQSCRTAMDGSRRHWRRLACANISTCHDSGLHGVEKPDPASPARTGRAGIAPRRVYSATSTRWTWCGARGCEAVLLPHRPRYASCAARPSIAVGRTCSCPENPLNQAQRRSSERTDG